MKNIIQKGFSVAILPILLLLMSVGELLGQTVPSTTGALCISCFPTGWSGSGGVSAISTTLNPYTTGIQWINAPLPAAPNGNTSFLYKTAPQTASSASTTISDLVAGENYSITMHFMLPLGSAPGTLPNGSPDPGDTYISPANIIVTIDGVAHPFTIATNANVWHTQTFNFTATGATASLSVNPGTSPGTRNNNYAILISTGADAFPPTEICDNGIDDDGDTLIDSADPDCMASCTGTISLAATNADAGASISYAYTDASGVIQEVTSGSEFMDVPEGDYQVYLLQYETGSLPATWAASQNVSATTSDACNQIVGPQMASVCCAASCTGTINLTAGNTDAGASVSFAYTDASGAILGVTDQSSFTDVPEGSYNVYALQYETGSLPTTWAVGQNISATTNDACNQVEGPQAVEICCADCVDGQVIVTNVSTPACPSNVLADIRIVNLGGGDIPTGTSISFYDGDPTMAGAILLGTYATTADVPNNGILNVKDVDTGGCAIGSGWLYAVIDDDGTATLPLTLATDLSDAGGYEDCDYTNNSSFFKIKERCGKYQSMIKR